MSARQVSWNTFNINKEAVLIMMLERSNLTVARGDEHNSVGFWIPKTFATVGDFFY